MSEYDSSPGMIQDALRYAEEELSRARGSSAAVAAAGIRRIIRGGSWEVQYGWVSRFEDGEEYEWGEAQSLDDARTIAAEYQEEEDARKDLPGRLTYSVRQRLVYVSDGWEEVPGDA